METAINIHDLSKSFGPLVAVKDLSLSVECGELFGLIGPDGAGKSTLYRMLATLLTPDQGRGSLLGLDLAKDPMKIRTEIGYMPERFSLYPDLSVMENLNFFASIFGVRVRDNFDLIEPVFAQLAQFPDRPAGKLSGGMKQKLALCCALIHRPRVLLLDEPTTGVDAVSRSEFWDMLATLKQQEITIMVSTSYMDEAERCDRVGIMNQGSLLRLGTPQELKKEVASNLFAAQSRDMFQLLGLLRTEPDIQDCYTFGDSLHFTASKHFNIDQTLSDLKKNGISDCRIIPILGNLEDLLISLIRNE